jgi:predicted nucleic acid-binding protein
MKLLFDTNVVLDVLLYRQPWVQTAQKLWAANDQQLLRGHLTATTITDIFYIARRQQNYDKAIQAVDICLKAFAIVPVERQTLLTALQLPGKDFEDNVQIACVQAAMLDGIVTRNPKDFKSASIAVFSMEDILAELSL